MVGMPVSGLTLGVPGVKVGPAVVGATVRKPMVGVSVSRLTLGVPGVKVGPAVVGATVRTPMVGVPVLGLTLEVPGVKVGPAVLGATVMGASAQKRGVQVSLLAFPCKDTNNRISSIGADTGSSWSQSRQSSGGSNCKDTNGRGAI
jgi:hypothetical protein